MLGIFAAVLKTATREDRWAGTDPRRNHDSAHYWHEVKKRDEMRRNRAHERRFHR